MLSVATSPLLWCKHAGSKYDPNLECDLPLCMFLIASGRSPVSATVEVSSPRSKGDILPQVVESLTSDDGVVDVAGGDGLVASI